MIEVVKIKERIRSHLLSHTTVPEDHLAIAGGSLPLHPHGALHP